MNITPERRAKLQRMAAEYDQWEAANLPSAVFDPARSHEGSDYNLHYLDYEDAGPIKLNKVGPKGYEHNWVFVGVPGVGGRVFHPQHGHGSVASHDGKSVAVHFDSGHKADFVAGHRHGEPRLEPTADHVQRVQGMNQGGNPPTKFQPDDLWDNLDDEERASVRRVATNSAHGEIKVNMSRASLDQVLADGRMKTLHEQKRIKGAEYFGMRDKYERSRMDVTGVADEHMPIYGTVNSKENGGTYGDVTVVLNKDRVRKRTTVTGGDSLNDGLVPIPLEKFLTGRPTDEEMANTMAGHNIQGFAYDGSDNWPDYMEAQIHGGLTLDDIGEVRFAPTTDPADQFLQDDLTQELEARGIKVTRDFDPEADAMMQRIKDSFGVGR